MIIFCIDCQEMVAAECYDYPFGCSHVLNTPVDNGQSVGLESDLCCFPSGWAACPPPEVPEEFAIPPQEETVFEAMQALMLV